ncbi:MAG TPA: dimethyl sulfoxide reductase anchor subunit [Tenuifilaceae bacterium]|nr:dimethyl sulfoxide reductase anchor subunit [Tenuifilaceae bacterium]
MASTTGFIFDYSKCVGCHACMVACYVENETKPPLSWRNVNHFNREKLPLLGFVHQSIACNHCKDAPCMKACPANAFSFDTETGAVIHNKEVCIGCKYCTWACPFDAPKFNEIEGIIEKCHLCYHRLKEGKIPACAINCPTGALSFGEIPENPHPDTFGFSQKPIFPRILVKGSNIVNSVPELDASVSGFDKSLQKSASTATPSNEINPLHELPLALFTYISSLLVGWFSANPFQNSFNIPLWVFGTLGLIAMLLSTFHLGKPTRAYLSIRNLKTSWLSREILLFGIFMVTGSIALFINSSIVQYVGIAIGFTFLLSIEMVYSVAVKKYKTPVHSSNTILTALTFLTLAGQLWNVLIVMLAIKTLLFTVRTGTDKRSQKLWFSLIVLTRLVAGFIVPFSFIAFRNAEFSVGIILLVAMGELVDRILFYGDFSPERPFSNVQ